ncbi:MAG: hypothetical protein KDA68_03985 [Planctomycetaceae bacterium]|nr:hypothetical protein [Planctomycetaceae bacterium]
MVLRSWLSRFQTSSPSRHMRRKARRLVAAHRTPEVLEIRTMLSAAPVLVDPGPQYLGVGEHTIKVDFEPTDPDNDPLTFTVETAGFEGFFLAKDLGLTSAGRKTNWGKAGEEWFMDSNKDYYFIKPNGDFGKWDGTKKSASGEILATLDPLFHAYPQLLTSARSNQDLSYILDHELGLSRANTPAQNSLGMNEKWFNSSDPRTDYYITPDGAFSSVYTSRNGKVVINTWLVDLPKPNYQDPAKLYSAAKDRFSASADSNGLVTVQTNINYAGAFFLRMTAKDASLSTSQIVSVAESDYVSPSAPRVVGAVSTANNKLVVSFSQPMNSSAINAANYAISQSSGGGVSALTVLSARFVNSDHSSVELTTLSQSEVTYTVVVTNVKDLGGTALASAIIQNGVLVDPTRATFTGTPPAANDLVDYDGDGLLDGDEQRGWQVNVTLLNGLSSSRWVTSDPLVADSDGDGLLDTDEFKLGLDPRNADTDRDQLTDYQEYNEIYSDPTNVDTDGDSLDDSLEFYFYHSSVTDPDTDGDQLTDDVEALLGNRNIRLADIPKPGIEIGEVNLQLDVRHTFTDTKGKTEVENQSVETNLTQSETKSFSNTDSTTNEFNVKVGVETGWKAGVDFGVKGSFSAEAGTTNSWSSSFTEESAKETQKAVTDSFSTTKEARQDQTVERSIEGASMKVVLNLKSLSNIAFTIKNLQVTAFIQDPSQFGKLIPVATLTPDNYPDEGYTLGPQVPERGPFIFSNDTIFASIVQQLMLNPKGLIFKISNYDIIDERGRNFAFSSQDINDRTAPLVIDFGFGDVTTPGVGGTTERYRVATSGGRIAVDTNGDNLVDANDRTVVFNPSTGRAVGITISDALQNVLGLTKYDETTTPSSSLSQLELSNSYSTKVVMADTDGNPNTPLVAVERLWRVRDVSSDLTNPLKKWVIYTSEGIDASTNFSDLLLAPEKGLTFKFLQDLDNDGIDAAQEYLLGSSDSNEMITVPTPTDPNHQQMKGYDSDLDGLPDAFEFYGGSTPLSLNTGWNIDVVGKTTYRAYSSPARKDSDLDGISDYDEYNRKVNGVRKSTDPQKPDTDGDGVSDYDEINGYAINLRFATQGGQTIITVMSDPLNRDTDGDTLKDGDERTLGTDPTTDDAGKVLDDDGDGLVNFLEDSNDPNSGWTVTVFAVSTTAGTQGTSSTRHVVSDPKKVDTDGDGLTDKEEYDLKTDPTKADTDGDGVNDIDELDIVDNGPGVPRTITFKYNPLDADIDNDLRTDGDELNKPIIVKVAGKADEAVFSDPEIADFDLDGLVDGEEEGYGTNPNNADTDGDNPGVNDAREIALGTNPLKADQKVRITIISIVMAGTVSDAAGGLDLWGTIYVGFEGSLQTVKSYSEEEVDTGYSLTLNSTFDFTLMSGDAFVLKTTNFFDNDDAGTDDGIADAGDDLFTDASVSFTYQVAAATGTLESVGDAQTGTDVKLQVNYKVEILT